MIQSSLSISNRGLLQELLLHVLFLLLYTHDRSALSLVLPPRSPRECSLFSGEFLIYLSYSMLTYTPVGFLPTLGFLLLSILTAAKKDRSV